MSDPLPGLPGADRPEPAKTDRAALDEIAKILRAALELDADTFNDIAYAVEQTGRSVVYADDD